MNEAQKVIKYFAYALAIFIIVSIFTTILEIVSIFSSAFEKTSDSVILSDVEYNNYLKLDLIKANLIVKTGDKLEVVSNSENILVKRENNKIFVSEKRTNFGKKLDLTITVPNDFSFDYVEIDSSIGNIDIKKLKTRNLDLDIGAGKLNINNLTVNKLATIDTGAGNVNINNAFVNELDLDLGAGTGVFNGVILGESYIEAGVGNFTLMLNESIDNYKFYIDEGIGSFIVNGNKMTDEYIGNGNTLIKIDGGIGKFEINTNN